CSNNILIQSNIAKITDFGLSRVLERELSTSRGNGTPAYKDPASFYFAKPNGNLELEENQKPNRRGKKSDIFSLGVILWEISSGKIPCEGRTESYAIFIYRSKRCRDAPFPGTPEEYIKLYTECWDEDP
ncbi:4359_t:CDS:1, partial [Paraglomus occultum]